MKLDQNITRLPLVGPAYAERLNNLDIRTYEDILNHVPFRFNDYRKIVTIANVNPGDSVTIQGQIDNIKNVFTKGGKRLQIGQVSDSTGSIQIVWFNQMYLTKNIHKGTAYSFAGKCELFNTKKSLISPDYEKLEKGHTTLHTGRLVPIYPETEGISSKWLRGRIANILNLTVSYNDFLPESTLNKIKLINLETAFTQVHFPQSLEEYTVAKARLAFNELLFHQLTSLTRKKKWQSNKAAHCLAINKKIMTDFTKFLPFTLTASQQLAISEILHDMQAKVPMNRLLEGDVGSGKTIVAASAAFAAFVNGSQSVFMAPTQILANQHYQTLKYIFDRYKMRVSLVTGEGVKADFGKSDIFIGTHALIHKKVSFDNVALIVIDEQHRFGVEQRTHLITKGTKHNFTPHVLTMTATPIPRTVALTIYGDLDLSVLTELPAGRLPTTTWLVPHHKRQAAYSWIAKQLTKTNVQAFIICPLIEESTVETMKQVKAATVEFLTLKKVFPDHKLGLLHGRQTNSEKNKTLDDFKMKKIDILVATPVVEVGIDVPNATIMIIEAAERFGLAQLHQMRGRIGRGTKKSYCLLFTDSKSPKVMFRLAALQKTHSGFELAEMDLQLRGPGEMFGIKQHGIPELKIATWADSDLIKKAQKVAEAAIENPVNYSALLKKCGDPEMALN